MRTVEFDLVSTLLVSMVVLFLGRFLVASVPVLRRLNIPAPVVGGGMIALVLALVSPLHAMGEVLFWAHMTQHQILRRVDRIRRAAAAADLDAMFQMMDGVQVRSAYAAGERFRNHLPRLRHDIGNVGYGQRSAAADRRAHRGTAHLVPASSVGLRWPSQPSCGRRLKPLFA